MGSLKGTIRQLYSSMHAHLPAPLQRSLSELVHMVPVKPQLFHDPSQHPAGGLPRGTVTFSIDFEMSWAVAYSRLSREDPVAMGLRERRQVPEILAAMNSHGVPATWATVGHLFLRQCTRGPNGLAHPELPRAGHFDSHWKFSSGDWFQHDPCTSVERDPAWYAPDLIEMILASPVKHELGCHGFSHLGFGSYAPDAVIAAELDACIAAMKPYGLRPVSLVFPGNDPGKFDLIASRGFRTVRWFPRPMVEISLPVRRPEGLWGLHATVDIEAKPRQDAKRRLALLTRYVEAAVETHMNAHFWFHPSLDPVQMRELLFPLLAYVGRRRDQGALDILTMDELAQAVAACQQSA